MHLTTIAFHRDNPIYAHDLKAYAADSKRSLADRILRKRHITRSSIKTHWNNIMGRTTLPNSTAALKLSE
jgi:DNA-binding CsgD family transcriptional regulator